MTDNAGGTQGGWAGSAWDDEPAPAPEKTAGGGAPEPGEPPPKDKAPTGNAEPSNEGEAAEPPDPFAANFRARESRGGQEARRERAAGARYNATYNYYHYESGEAGPGGIRVGPVDARELADARREYVPPDFYPKAAEMLGRRGLVVLAYGLLDNGKRRAALNLLGAGAEPVSEIDPRADLGDLAAFGFEPGGRYLVEIATDAAARALGQFALDRLRERLAQRASRLVLVVASRLHLPSEELGDYGVVCGDPVAAWFDSEDRGLSEYALMLGVAVLGGISHQAVVDAADRLHRSLAEATDEEATTKRIFGTLSHQRAAAVHARVRDWVDETEFGDIPVKIVEFLDHDWYSAVLQFIWEHKELMRPPLLRWMEQLCAEGNDEVRLRAASAVGDLCRHDFGYVWRHVIRRWATSEDEALRRAAAWAAGLPATDAQLAPHVLGWLQRWAEDRDEPVLRWTAAAAFGSYWIGRRFPDESLRVLGTMLEREPKLGFHISEGMGVLFEIDGEIAAKVVRALLKWSKDRKRTPASLGIFCNIAYGNERPRGGKDGPGWPSVLWLWDREGGMRPGIVTLFRHSLDDPAAKRWGLEVIEHWTRQADDEPGVEAALGCLLRDLSVTHREWRRLVIHLRSLASKRGERPSRAASRLLGRLMAAEPVTAY